MTPVARDQRWLKDHAPSVQTTDGKNGKWNRRFRRAFSSNQPPVWEQDPFSHAFFLKGLKGQAA